MSGVVAISIKRLAYSVLLWKRRNWCTQLYTGNQMNLDSHEFQKWIDDDENHEDVLEWFEENYRKFPDEFELWEKAVKK